MQKQRREKKKRNKNNPFQSTHCLCTSTPSTFIRNLHSCHFKRRNKFIWFDMLTQCKRYRLFIGFFFAFCLLSRVLFQYNQLSDQWAFDSRCKFPFSLIFFYLYVLSHMQCPNAFMFLWFQIKKKENRTQNWQYHLHSLFVGIISFSSLNLLRVFFFFCANQNKQTFWSKWMRWISKECFFFVFIFLDGNQWLKSIPFDK